MKLWIQRSLAVVALITMVVIVVSCSGGAGGSASSSGSTADPQVLLEERCTPCHSLGRVTLASKSEAQWNRTVSQMVAMGAQLTPEEQKVLVAYLAKTYGP